MEVAIFDLQRSPDTGYVSAVVFAFCLTKDGHTYYSERFVVGFEGDSSDAGFVDYESLTHAAVSEWVKSSIAQSRLDEIQAGIEHEIAQMSNQLHGVPWTLTGLNGE